MTRSIETKKDGAASTLLAAKLSIGELHAACANGEQITILERPEAATTAKRHKHAFPDVRPLDQALSHAFLSYNAAAQTTTSEREAEKFSEIALVLQALLRVQVREKKMPAPLARAARDVLDREMRSDRAKRLLKFAEARRHKLQREKPETILKFIQSIRDRARSLGFRPGPVWRDPFDGVDPATLSEAEIDADLLKRRADVDAAAKKMETDAVEAVRRALSTAEDDEKPPGTRRLTEVILQEHGLDDRGMFDYDRKAASSRAKRRKT